MIPAPRVLMLSLSRDLARSPQPTANEDQLRQLAYAELCGSVDIVVKTPDHEDFAFRQLRDDVRVHPVRSRSRAAAAIGMWRLAWRLARSRRPNVIVSQEPFVLGVFAWLLARWTGAALCVHDVCDFIENPHWLRERASHRLLNVVAKFVLRRATTIRVDSRDEGAKLAALGMARERIHFIPFLQPGLERFRRQPAPDPRPAGDGVVLFAARLEKQKGLDTLLEVISQVGAVRPQTRFIVVGDGSERAAFERGLADRGLEAFVEMAGWQSIEGLPAFFHRSDVFLLTSRYETSARVLYLADEAGLRIVTTEVSGAREVVGDRHAVAAVGDAAALARLVLTALTTPSAAAPAAKNSEALYSEPQILRGFQRLLRESVQGAQVVEEAHLCYVLPKYEADTAEHFLHTYELLSTLSESARLTVIVERSHGEPRFGSAVVYRQRFADWLPLRITEVTWLLLRARLQGARTFYIHYSNVAVLAAWLVTRACGGRVCYWHCVSRFFRHAGHGLAAWRHKVTAEWPLMVTMRLIDVLVTGTPSLAAMYRRSFGLADVRVVPNEINPARFGALPGAADRIRGELQLDAGPVVLFVHRLAPRKGALRLPALARALVAAVPRASVVIVGDGPSAPALRQEVSADPALARRVRFTGWVTNTQISAYYAMSDVLIMPSEEEGFPRVLLEAMAAGVPFVATDVGGVRDLCSEAQQWGIVPLDDEAAFADRVVTLLKDPARRAALREDGLRHVHRYAVPVVARRTLSELNMLQSADQLTLAPREVSA